MAKTEKNTVGTLEISFNEGNVMIVDHIRKVKAIIRQCHIAYFFDGDDFVLIKKDDGTYGLYKAGFGFILKNQGAVDVFYPAHLKNFIATIITSSNEVLLLDVEGNITKANRNFLDYKICREYKNGNILMKRHDEQFYNIFSSDLTPLFDEDLVLIESETWPYMVLATDNGEGEYNVLNTFTGEFVFADWKYYIGRTEANGFIVQNDTKVSIYNGSFVLKETKTFETRVEALDFLIDVD